MSVIQTAYFTYHYHHQPDLVAENMIYNKSKSWYSLFIYSLIFNINYWFDYSLQYDYCLKASFIWMS